MNKEQVVSYLRFSGFSDEQIKAIEGAFSGWGKVCPSAGVDCEDCPAYEDTISRKAVIDTLERMDKALDEDRTVESYKDLLRECYKVLPSVTPKPKSECEHDHEILKAYSDGANAVLESLIEQYEHYLELLDADMKDGSATIVTKTKYAVYTEVVKQLKEVLESEEQE